MISESLLDCVQKENAALLRQLKKSRALRLRLCITLHEAAPNDVPYSSEDDSEGSKDFQREVQGMSEDCTPLKQRIDIGGTESALRSNAMAPPSPQRPLTAARTRMEGPLLRLSGRGAGGGGFASPILLLANTVARSSAQFVPQYVVADEAEDGIAWYANANSFRKTPRAPLGRVPFWRETTNSRGSRFKKAAVCWPLILPEDCPQATDSHLTYFAVEYVNEAGAHEKVVLAASSPLEREEWVCFLTKYIDMYLAPRSESRELQSMTRGADVPVHRSGVIDGEAPGGNYV